MSAKMTTLYLLKTKVFWSKGYDIIFPVHDITNKILSHDSNIGLVTLVFIGDKLL